MKDTTKQDAVLERFYSKHYQKYISFASIDKLVVDEMADHIVRLESVLAKLKDPSKSVVGCAGEEVPLNDYADYDDMRRAIIAAVTAAEEEVGV